MTGMELEPTPPATATDMLGAIVADGAGRAGRRRRRRAAARLRPRHRGLGRVRLVPAGAGRRRRRSAARAVGSVAMAETMVRMGELAASAVDGDVLVSLGLGSCIGLALLDRRLGVAGLAHVVLPSSGGHAAPGSFKFADSAVPELIDASSRPVAGARCSTPCWSAARACSPCLRPRSKSASATRPPCATSSPRRTSRSSPPRPAATAAGRSASSSARGAVTVREAGGADKVLVGRGMEVAA